MTSDVYKMKEKKHKKVKIQEYQRRKKLIEQNEKKKTVKFYENKVVKYRIDTINSQNIDEQKHEVKN